MQVVILVLFITVSIILLSDFPLGCQHKWKAGAAQWKYKQYLEQDFKLFYPCYLFECEDCGRIMATQNSVILSDLTSGLEVDYIIFKADNSEKFL